MPAAPLSLLVSLAPAGADVSVLTAADVSALFAAGIPCIVTMHGDSMRPALPRGTRVRLVPLAVDAAGRACARRGEVVAIARADEVVLHRVVYASREWIGHQGDATWRSAIARHSAVIGRVDAVIGPRPEWRAQLGRVTCAVRAARQRLWSLVEWAH